MDNSAALQSAAKSILAVFAPNLARIVNISIIFGDFSTASTDGSLVIKMPHEFAGYPIPENAPITLGLLAHELGHWVQPLKEISEVERTEHIPGWVSNILLDIHGESFVEALFPAMKTPLSRTRKAVNDAKLAKFEKALRDILDKAVQNGWTDELKAGAVNIGMLIARFCYTRDPYQFYRNDFPNLPGDVASAIVRGERFKAEYVTPKQLPRRLKKYIRDFPFLRNQEKSSFLEVIPWAESNKDGPLGEALKKETENNMQNLHPSNATGKGWSRQIVKIPQHTYPEAKKLACILSLRFKTAAGGITVTAPGALNRLDMARGNPAPFDMELKGKSTPAPQVALILDASSSMFNDGDVKRSSIGATLIAAQALSLTLLNTGGSVKTAIFDQRAIFRDNEALAFARYSWVRNRFDNLTSFEFLRYAWREWENHFFIVLTDGAGTNPDIIFPKDRERTVVVYIGYQKISSRPWAHKTVSIAPNDLNKLAFVFASLIPRRFTQY
jgi:hypothetical protein